MSGLSPLNNRSASPSVRQPAAVKPTAQATALGGDSLKTSRPIKVEAKATGSSGQNLAQPIGMLGIMVGGFGWLATSNGAAGAFGPIPLAFIACLVGGLALAGSGVVIKKPDGTTGRAGAGGAIGVILPGAGLAIGAAGMMALGLSGWPAMALISASFLVCFAISRALVK